MPDTLLASETLPPDGGTLLTPPLGAGAENSYRIELEGLFQFDRTGMAFDAAYRADAAGNFTLPHPYLAWTPRTPPLESYDSVTHRCVFRIPAEWNMAGQSVG